MRFDIIFLAGGLLALVAAVKEAKTQRLLDRQGLRAVGTVIRYDRKQDPEGGTSYYPVIAYADAQGIARETNSIVSGKRKWPIGREVPVVFLPQAPAKARIDTNFQRRARVVIPFLVGTVIITVAIVLMAKH
jgi:hypothetical protein